MNTNCICTYVKLAKIFPKEAIKHSPKCLEFQKRIKKGDK